MRDVAGGARLPRDPEDLVHPVENPLPLEAHVVDHERVVPPDDLADLDQFLGVRVDARRIDQAGRETASSLLDRRIDQRLDCGQLPLGRRAVVHPHHVQPDGSVADHSGHVNRRAIDTVENPF